MSGTLGDLSAYLGEETGPYTSWDPVNAPMIRHWCEAMGDDNPLYTEGFAPPTMLQAWGMVGYRGRRAPGSDERPTMAVLPVLEQAGYPAVVATNCEQEYSRYLEVGDEIYYRSSIESISAEKQTALGTGFFVTELSTYYDQDNEVVGTMRFRVFKYRAPEREKGVATAAMPAAATVAAPDASGFSAAGAVAADLAPGDTLPPLAIPITPKLIVGAAIASRDYQNVHHDKAAAQALGSPDIFMNILTTNGLVGRYVTDWAGGGARLNRIAIRLGAPNYPGDTMRFTGEVLAADAATGRVELDVKGGNNMGYHVMATVDLTLPCPSA